MALDIRVHTLWAALTLAACTTDPPADEGHTTTSPGGSETGDATGDTADTTGDTTTGAQEPALVIVVVATPPYPEPNTPAVNAVVALDTADGRLEAVTDAEGRAYFEGFEWSGESVDVTVGALDYVMKSWLDLDEADTNEAGELELEIYSLDVSDSAVEISGPVLNKQSNSHDVIASIGGVRDFWDSASTWSAVIAPDQPFSLVALELTYLDGGPNGVDNPIFGWFTLEHPGVSEDTQVAIDFAMPTAPEYAAGSFAVPERPDSPLRVDNFGFIYTVAQLSSIYTSRQMIGRATASSLSVDGNTIDYELEYVSPPNLTDPHTCFRVVSQVAFVYSTACIPGLPSDGAQDVDLIDATEVVFVPNRTLYDPVEFELHDVAVVPELRITYGFDPVWQVVGPPDATSLTVPKPPTGFESGGVTLDVSLWLGRIAPDGEGYYEAWVVMEPFSVDS